MSPSATEITNQLKLLRELTRSTGMLHEAQVLHLEMWAKIMITGIGKFQMLVDIDTKTITYDIHIRGKRSRKNVNEFKKLEKSVQWLLGNDWLMLVSANKQRLHTGRRRPMTETVKSYNKWVEVVNRYGSTFGTPQA